MELSQDFQDLLAAFARHRVEYLLIGGYAVAFHSRPRFTKDIDLWVGSDPSNLRRACDALHEFGAPPSTLRDLETSAEDDIVWFGIPPARVDLLKRIAGVTFAEAHGRRETAMWGNVRIAVISAEDLIRAKEAAGREQDLEDAALVRRCVRRGQSRKNESK